MLDKECILRFECAIARRIAALIAIFLSAVTLNVTAAPTLIGDRVDVMLTGDASRSLSQVLVTNSFEVDPYGNGNYQIDIFDDGITFTVINGPFCGFFCDGGSMNILVSDMDWIGFPDASIASATLTNVGGGDGFGLAFGADSVSFQVADTSQNRGEQVRIAFTVDPGEVEVSEPSTAFLLGLSFIALGLFVQCRPMWDA